jgi:hypothetical protein
MMMMKGRGLTKRKRKTAVYHENKNTIVETVSTEKLMCSCFFPSQYEDQAEYERFVSLIPRLRRAIVPVRLYSFAC